MMKIYTRTGDKGKTSLFGGTRVSKSSPRLHAYGSLDELNACLGSVVADTLLPEALREQVKSIQHLLFEIGADLATPLASTANIKRTETVWAKRLEEWIDALDTHLPPMTAFILPGGAPCACKLHEARTICRRAERWIVHLQETDDICSNVIIVINRLSDFLFTAARFCNHALKTPEHRVEIERKA